MKITRTLHHRWFSTTSAKLAAGLLLHCAGLAQSTTDWIPVGPPASGGLARNSTYVTVTLEHGRLNAKANWWTKLIGTQKKAVVTASIYADYGTGATPFEDKRSSASFDVKKYDSPVDLAWKQSLAVNLPATFRLLRVSVSFATSAKDGADELLKVAGDISSKVPNPTPSQNIIGFVSVAKSLIDYLVGNQLLKEQLKSTGELITTATQPMTPGYYVVFAGNSAEDYAKYTENKEGLSWDHAVLRLGTNVVSDVSYFILKLDYVDRVFPQKTLDVLSNIRAPWASLYLAALEEVGKLDEKNSDQVVAQIRTNLQSAQKVLNLDVDYTLQEKTDIHDELRRLILDRYKKQAAGLGRGEPFMLKIQKQALDLQQDTTR